MKAHKVPATYYASWNIPGTKESFYVFYKSHLDKEGISKRYREVDKITQEHSFFMADDFYYLDIAKTPGLIYKLKNEIEEFLKNKTYSIKYQDSYIKDFDNFKDNFENIDSWAIVDTTGTTIANETFKNELNTDLSNKIRTIIEDKYFARELEQKWNTIKAEIENPRNTGDDFCLTHKKDFLEFFVIQYCRLDDIMKEYIEPILDKCKKALSSMGLEESDLNNLEDDGLLAFEPYFYGFLLDAARGDKQRLQKYMDSIEKSYIIDLLKAESGISFITSTTPCVVTKIDGAFKSEMLFPITPQYCIRFVGKVNTNNENGKFFEITKNEVKEINQQIVSNSPNIVISKSKLISSMLPSTLTQVKSSEENS